MIEAKDVTEQSDEVLLAQWVARLGTVEGQLIREFQIRFYKAFGPTTVRAHASEATEAALSCAAAMVALQDDGQCRMSADEFAALAKKIYRTCRVFGSAYDAGAVVLSPVAAKDIEEVVHGCEAVRS